jgi:predicted dehydrogenase
MVQVGLGDFGQRWMHVVHDNDSWEIAAIATRNDTVRDECGNRIGLEERARFRTLEEALSSGIEADTLLVTTPHFRHAADVVLGLEHGLNVLVEKPLSGTWGDCLRIREAAEASDRIVMVGENYRYGEGARMARDLVLSGEIGEPELLSMEYFVGHTFPEGDWRNEYTYPLLIENATHQFDLVRYVTGRDAEQVYCVASGSARTPHWRSPNASANFLMGGGLSFQFTGSWAYGEFNTPWEGIWRLHGSRGSLAWRSNELVVSSGSNSRTIAVPSRPSDATLTATLAEYTAALDAGRAPETSLEDNMQTVAMVYGAIRSAETGTPVSIAEMLAERP